VSSFLLLHLPCPLLPLTHGLPAVCIVSAETEEEDSEELPPSPYELEEDGWTGSDDPDYVHFDGKPAGNDNGRLGIYCVVQNTCCPNPSTDLSRKAEAAEPYARVAQLLGEANCTPA